MRRNTRERFWEIDALRGIAILMMIAFHVLFDMSYFGASNFTVRSGFWLYFARATATIFLLLVGISLTLRACQKITCQIFSRFQIPYPFLAQ